MDNQTLPIGAAHDAVKRLIEQVIGSGLWSAEDNGYFTWQGCDYCAPSPGNTVYNVRGFTNLASAQASNREELEHDFYLCGECINTLYYGKVGK
jgi:hypothetical protein